MPVRPADLPRLRRQVLAQLDNPDAPLRTHTSSGIQEGLSILASHLRVADLYWVSPEMAALAVHAGGELAATTWTIADRPSGCGLLWWGDGVHQLDMGDGLSAPIDALSWGPHKDGVAVWLFIHRDRVHEGIRKQGGELVTQETPPLVPMLGEVVPFSADPLPVTELAAHVGPSGPPVSMLMTLAAAWSLMQQPTLVERTRETVGKGEVRSAARAGLPVPEYSRVDLRRQFRPQDQDPDDGGGSRHYRYRWVVSGHWRTYRSDRFSDELRASKRWIPSYVKGPEGAPLLSTEKVNVWRR